MTKDKSKKREIGIEKNLDFSEKLASARVFLSLGSNLSSKFGDRFSNINKAITLLKKEDIKIIKISSFYETPSFPNKKNPKFINVVIMIKTKFKSSQLMKIILKIEKIMGRKRRYKNQPRICDIDIIDYNSNIIKQKLNRKNLIIPHHKMTKRNFVLFPLKQICSKWKHPKTRENISNLIKKLPKKDHKSILKINMN